jgi:RHS repeat-associated protein
MQLASSRALREPPPAAMRLGGEKPHQGLSSKKPASHRGLNRCKSMTALWASQSWRPESVPGATVFRKYDPSAGRWLSPDPAGWLVVDQTDPQSLDRYAYVENQPMSNVDPNGQWMCFSGVSGEGLQVDPGMYCYSDGYGYSVEADSPGFNFNDNGTISQTGIGIEGYWYQIEGNPGSQPIPDWLQTTMNYMQSISDFSSGHFNYSGWAKDVKNCVADVGLPTLGEDLSPIPSFENDASNPGGMISDSLGAASAAVDSASQATNWATMGWMASRGLTVPLRSGVVRAGFANLEKLGEYADGLLVVNILVAGVHADIREIKECL